MAESLDAILAELRTLREMLQATRQQPTPAPKSRPRLRPAILRRPEAASYCGVGTSSWDRLTAAGLTPAPVRVGGSVGWSRKELAAWIDHGCPPRDEWEAIWAEARRRARK